jgi:hypothetical protein
MDPLAEMHLLLRQHGWEPEYDEEKGLLELDAGRFSGRDLALA